MKFLPSIRLCVLATSFFLASCGGGGGGSSTPAPPPEPSAEAKLAATIRSDTRLTEVRAKARQLVSTGYSAGDVYGSIYIRDTNTFIELAIETRGAPDVRAQLRRFLELQGSDGNIIDAISLSDGSVFKATVETDQESSLVQAVSKYVAISGDKAFLNELIGGVSVIQRLENALTFLYTKRYSTQYGMIWGGTRADWGDVQPEDDPGVTLNELSHPNISIYDNAMLGLALTGLRSLETTLGRDATVWIQRQQQLRAAVRTHLWTGTQFIPHLYLEKGSPFPLNFDEARIYFQGGTGVAIQAGFLEPAEIALTYARMIKNKADAGAGSIGLSLFPSYPANFFRNTTWMGPEYFYQNGGDWPWFGARIVQTMIANGQPALAYQELTPMLTRVLRDDAFFEWYTREGQPRGSNQYRGSAGQIANAIDMLLAWAKTQP